MRPTLMYMYVLISQRILLRSCAKSRQPSPHYLLCLHIPWFCQNEYQTIVVIICLSVYILHLDWLDWLKTDLHNIDALHLNNETYLGRVICLLEAILKKKLTYAQANDASHIMQLMVNRWHHSLYIYIYIWVWVSSSIITSEIIFSI